MRNITCIAIDDEPMALLVIEQFCRRRGGMELLTFSEPHLGIEEIGRLRPDLVFLDIEMNGVSGLDIAAQLPRDCCLIFTTGHARYALDGFNLDAVDFLHKPFAYERFEMAVDKALRRIAQLRPAAEENLVVKQEYKSVSIPLDQILYIEALGNYCKIFCTDGHCILSHAGLKSLQSMLPPAASCASIARMLWHLTRWPDSTVPASRSSTAMCRCPWATATAPSCWLRCMLEAICYGG